MTGSDDQNELEGDDLSDAEISALRDLVGEVTLADSRLVRPPAGLWDSIAAELDLEGDGLDLGNSEIGSPEIDNVEIDNVVPIRRTSPMVLAAAAAVVLIVGLGVLIGINGDNENAPNDDVVASVEIVNDDLPVASSALGQARLIQTEDGLELDVDVNQLATDEGYLELWIINSDVTDMHSLGEVNGDGRYVLPDGVDPADFPIVDISVEQRDGVAAHSGQSVLRGVLDL